jgi:hypothetical protein
MARITHPIRIVLLCLAAIPAILVAALIVIAAYSVVRSSQEVVLPIPSGPHRIGRVALDWVDRARAETFASTADAKRELLVWLWYPASTVEDARPAPYLPDALLAVREDSIWSALTQREGVVHPHAIADAPLAADQLGYPVVLFEPGLGAAPPDYTVLAEDLASHGFVVVWIFPTYSTDVVFPDGRVVRSTPAAREPPDDASVARLAGIWSDDVVFAINQLQSLNADPTSPFHDHLDLGRLGVFGHSVGGATALEVCRRDRRCGAAFDVDGSPLGEVIASGLAQPVMFVLHEGFDADCPTCAEVGGDVGSIFHGSTGGSYRVVLTGARHFNFRDAALFYRPGAHLIGALGPIDPRRGLRVVADYVAAFFNQSLNGTNESLLRGPSPDEPEARFERRG